MEKIKIGSDCCGVGSLIQAVKRLGIDYEESFACDLDYYARLNYCIQYGTSEDVIIAQSKQHKFFCDEVKRIALMDINIEVSDEDKQILVDANDFAKTFSFYFPFNMYEREVPDNPIDLYMSSVPCQAFSLAGKRKGKEDKRGILFFSSLDFIKENKPRYFIFENVKGLLSHNKTDKKAKYGKTFSECINYLGGKSINGNATFIPYEDSVPYHIYFQVLNAKEHGVPQNRERIFIVGIRDDSDNNFRFPAKEILKLRLKDILEPIVDEKYFLSDKMLDYLYDRNENSNFGKGKLQYKDENSIGYVESAEVRQLNPSKESGGKQPFQHNRVYDVNGVMTTLDTDSGRKNILIDEPTIVVHSLFPRSSKTGKGGTGHLSKNDNTSYCVDTSCNQAIEIVEPNLIKVGALYENDSDAGRVYSADDINSTIKSDGGGLGAKTGLYEVDGIITNSNFKDKRLNETLDSNNIKINETKILDTYNRSVNDISPTILEPHHNNIRLLNNKRIRRLTPTEVFRLMDFDESFMDNVKKYNETNPKNDLSDSQLYKQGGNSIVVACLEKIIRNLKF